MKACNYFVMTNNHEKPLKIQSMLLTLWHKNPFAAQLSDLLFSDLPGIRKKPRPDLLHPNAAY